MVIVTGSQHSGKSTIAKYLKKDYVTFFDYVNHINSVDKYKLILQKLSKHDVVECGLKVALVFQLLDIKCKTILVKSNRNLKYQRLNAMSGKRQWQYEVEFDEGDKIERILNTDIIVYNNETIGKLYETIDQTIKPRISGWL